MYPLHLSAALCSFLNGIHALQVVYGDLVLLFFQPHNFYTYVQSPLSGNTNSALSLLADFHHFTVLSDSFECNKEKSIGTGGFFYSIGRICFQTL